VLFECSDRLSTTPETEVYWFMLTGSAATLEALRQRSGYCPSKTVVELNEFPRVRGSNIIISSHNPSSMQTQYLQLQEFPDRVKTPLIPPREASQLTATDLKDRILGGCTRCHESQLIPLWLPDPAPDNHRPDGGLAPPSQHPGSVTLQVTNQSNSSLCVTPHTTSHKQRVVFYRKR